MRCRLAGGFGPLVAPHTQIRPAGSATESDVAHVSAPTVSTTTWTPPPVSSFTRAATSSLAWFTVASAPSSRARASFSSDEDVTTARAPSALTIASAAVATPPPIPQIEHPLVRLQRRLRDEHPPRRLEDERERRRLLERERVGDRVDVRLGHGDQLGVRPVHVLADDGDPRHRARARD